MTETEMNKSLQQKDQLTTAKMGKIHVHVKVQHRNIGTRKLLDWVFLHVSSIIKNCSRISNMTQGFFYCSEFLSLN